MSHHDPMTQQGHRVRRGLWFTSTERVEVTRGELRVGKPYMVSRLTSLLETGRVKLGDTPQRMALVEELRDFEFRVSAAALLPPRRPPRLHPDTDDWTTLHSQQGR